MLMQFEWYENKNQANIKKHGISFPLAARIFETNHVSLRSDREGEERYIAIGKVYDVCITVAYTLRCKNIRLISARRSRRNERTRFEDFYK